MPRFAANISTMFTELDPLDRIQAARDAGFEGVEFQFIYDLEIDDLTAATARAGVAWSVINFATGADMKFGPLIAADPGATAEFKKSVAGVKRYAEALKPRAVVIPAFRAPDGVELAVARAALAVSLAYAGQEFADIGVQVIVEPLNPSDRPGAVLNTTAEAMAVIDEAGHPNVGLEYDTYHMYIVEGPDMAPTIERLLPHIGNIQFADVPGRHEPGSGDVDFEALFKAIDDMGYDGWTAAEYTPTGATLDSLEWFEAYR